MARRRKTYRRRELRCNEKRIAWNESKIWWIRRVDRSKIQARKKQRARRRRRRRRPRRRTRRRKAFSRWLRCKTCQMMWRWSLVSWRHSTSASRTWMCSLNLASSLGTRDSVFSQTRPTCRACKKQDSLLNKSWKIRQANESWPILASLPLLDWLWFTKSTTNTFNSNLIIFNGI